MVPAYPLIRFVDTPIFINMKKYFAAFAAVYAAFILISCAGLPRERIEPLPSVPEENLWAEGPGLQPRRQPPETVPVIPEVPVPELPQPPEKILGKGMVSGEKLTAFLLRNNSGADMDFVDALMGLYVEEAAAEGVNHDTAFAQMCLETGFLRYGGLVTPDKNNFCGLGAIGPEEPGLAFSDPQTGVRAHIQHLKAYATDEPLNYDLVDPRYHYVKLGSSPTIHGLSGTWAADRMYSGKIAAILKRLYDFAFNE